MKRMLSGSVRAAALSALTVAAVLAAVPAAASAWATNESYALQASGAVNVWQAGEASYTGGSPVFLPNADAAGLLSTGPVTDRAGADSASSGVHDLTMTLPGHGTLRARAVSTTCRYTRSGGVSGSAAITGGVVQAEGQVIRLPASGAPNTRIVVPGVAAIMLNRQYTGATGALTVAAVRVRMLRAPQLVLLATSVCAAADLAAAPVDGGVAIRLAISALVLLALGAAAYAFTRRRRKLLAA